MKKKEEEELIERVGIDGASRRELFQGLLSLAANKLKRNV